MRLCPDIEKMASFLKIKNGYSNVVDRASFSLNIYKCNSTNCHSPKKIGKMLNTMMFNIYTVTQDVEIGNYENYGKTPLLSGDKFHS